MALLTYRGSRPVTFRDVTVLVPIDPGDPTGPKREVTARVGEVQPDQAFSVPDECAEAFTRRTDIELCPPPAEPEQPMADSAPPAVGKPNRGRAAAE